MIGGVLTAFGLGFLYFISAIPAGVTAHAPLWIAALAAWIGYSLGSLVVLFAGAPMRVWLLKKLKINLTPDPSKLFWRIWHRFGIWGLGLIAPITLGPQGGALLALALGESTFSIQLSFTLGALPWVIGIAWVTHTGTHLLG